MVATADEIRTAWDDIAAGYDRHVTDRNAELAALALDRAAVGAGTRLLDVAAGTGALSLPAARRGAAVTAVDISPGMVERLTTRAAAEGLDVDARAMDGHALDLDDDPFDVAGSQFGVMLFGDLAAGLAETARVTRPGGTVLVVAFAGGPGDTEFLGFFAAALRVVAPDVAASIGDRAAVPFQVGDPDVLTARMADAGIGDIDVETVEHRTSFRSGADLWTAVAVSNPIGARLAADLTPDQGDEVRHVLDGMLQERAQTGAARLVSPVHIATGRV